MAQDELAQKHTVPLLTLEEYLNTVFLPYYVKTVELSTYKTALNHFDILKKNWDNTYFLIYLFRFVSDSVYLYKEVFTKLCEKRLA